MTNDLIVGVILLSIGGLAGLSYKNEDGYKNIAKIILILTVVSYSILGALRLLVNRIMSDITGEISYEEIKIIKTSINRHIPNIDTLTFYYFIITAILVVLYYLPKITKKDKIN